MLSPTAWAIIKGLGEFNYGKLGVETGNAVKPSRPGTKPLRKLKDRWYEAATTHKNYRGSEPPYGYTDQPAVPFAPSDAVLKEIKTYTLAVRPRGWGDTETAGIPSVISFCLAAKRRRTHREHLKLTKTL
jgi:hypothetical protein